MSDLTRRKLLRSALAAGGIASAATLLPPNLQRAMAEPARTPDSLDEIEHVVILMLENRSFDHYFGTMPGVRGFDDPTMATLPDGRSVLYQPDEKNPLGYLLPFHLDTKSTSSQAIPSTSHAWAVQHQAVNGGKMDSWLPAHRKADGDAHGPYTMGYYTAADIPFHFALAESFTILDNYHCSLLGPTWPNRFYHMTGMIDPNGTGGGPVISNVVPTPYTYTTYPERLTRAGVSWHVYQQEDDYGCNPLDFFAAYQNSSPGDPLYEHGLRIGAADQFAQDAMNDRLPTVSWIIPTSSQSEHPAYLPAAGADFLARQLDALAANRDVWRKTVFILNYDENDGLFDHVVPPLPPDGTADEFVGGLPIGAGIRVPAMVISPWTQGGYVASEQFDHTSVLRFLEQVTGVKETNISAWRRATFGDLTSALGLPKSKPFPRLPDSKPLLWEAEEEVATLPPITLPTDDQTPPHQGTAKAAAPSATPTAPADGGTGAKVPGPDRYFRSRDEENRTTGRADFPHGAKGTNFPGLLDAAPEAVPTGPAFAYVAEVGGSSVVIVDPATHTMVGKISAGTNPYGIARDPAGTHLWVTQSGASAVSLLDLATGTRTATVTVGLMPHGVVVSPDGARVYVANTGGDTGPGGSRTVSVIDAAGKAVTDTWDVGTAPHNLALTPDGKLLLATCFDGLVSMDTAHGRPRGRTPGLGRAIGLAVHPDGERAYVANPAAGTVAFVDTRSLRVLRSVRVGVSPWQLAVDPGGARVYVTTAGDDRVTALDAKSGRRLGSATAGRIPTALAVGNGEVWVGTNSSGTAVGIDASSMSVLGTAQLGFSTMPTGIVVAPGAPA